MKLTNFSRNLATIAAAVTLAVSAVAQDVPISAKDSILVSVSATVQAIDQTNREVTVKGPLGNVVTFTVDKRVKRLNEVKVGDDITAEYYISFAGELRTPTPEEKQSPVQITTQVVKAPKGTEPAAGALRVMKVVTTVEGLDLPTQSVTLKGQGPKGYTATIRAKNVDNLKQLRLGDTIVVTFTEALAISLEKVKAKKKQD